MIRIRPFEASDWPAVWGILEPVFRAGETYAVPRDLSEEEARRFWTGEEREAFVADEGAGEGLLGTYFLKANQAGPGDHVCNCGYAVAVEARGRGLGARLCEHSQQMAVERGFRAMQFNLVVATNAGAVALWERLGFAVVGTLPGAFLHPELGFVDAHVMYKDLGPGS